MPEPSGCTISTLIASASKTADCRDARCAWAERTSRLHRSARIDGMSAEGRATSAAWLAAHRELDEFLTQAVTRLSEDEFERLCEAEFAKVDAMMAQLRAALEDKWPRELYRGGI